MVTSTTDAPQSVERTYPQWITAIIANTALLTYGLQAGWVSSAIKTLQSADSPLKEPLTSGELAWVGSILCFAAAVSTPVYSYIADAHGRRLAISVAAGLQAITWIIKLTATTATHLIIARFICGLSCGGCYNIVPSYTKDISQDHIRGLLGSLLMLFQNFGFLAIYAMGIYLEYFTVIWSVIWIPWVTMVLIWCVPESPETLVKKGRVQEAAKAVAFLRGLKHDDKLVALQISRLETTERYYESQPSITYATIFRDRCYRKSLFIVTALGTFKSLNGNFAIMTYASSIMTSSGVTVSPELQTLSFPAIIMVGSLVFMGCVEKLERKFLLVSNFIGACLALTVLAATLLHQQQGGYLPGWVPATTIVVSLFTYAAGILPLPYIIMTEMLNFQVRCKIMGIVVSYIWLISFVQLSTFIPLSNAVGMYSTFFVYAAVNLLGAVVCFIIIPRTRGRSTEEIEADIRKEKKTRSGTTVD